MTQRQRVLAAPALRLPDQAPGMGLGVDRPLVAVATAARAATGPAPRR